MLEVMFILRQLYKNTKQKVLNNHAKDHPASIENINFITNLDKFTTKFSKIITKDIELSVSIAKPSFYNKKQQTKELF